MGMEGAHEQAAGMGGIKTAGDMVLRMQLYKGMRIDEAKAYVAEKLGVSVSELCDCSVMAELRADKGLGGMQLPTGDAIGMECKFRIAEILDIPINSVNKFKERAGLK